MDAVSWTAGTEHWLHRHYTAMNKRVHDAHQDSIQYAAQSFLDQLPGHWQDFTGRDTLQDSMLTLRLRNGRESFRPVNVGVDQAVHSAADLMMCSSASERIGLFSR